MDEDLYETDFYTWTQRQAEHLRAGRLDHADIGNIAEEIESLGESQATALRSACRLIAMHLLKLMFQAGRAPKSWKSTLTRERLNAEQHLADGPGLKPRRAELFEQACRAARREAAAETGLPLPRRPALHGRRGGGRGLLADPGAVKPGPYGAAALSISASRVPMLSGVTGPISL